VCEALDERVEHHDGVELLVELPLLLALGGFLLLAHLPLGVFLGPRLSGFALALGALRLIEPLALGAQPVFLG
jgi:hypothetical protein